jgi:hypothetical protein
MFGDGAAVPELCSRNFNFCNQELHVLRKLAWGALCVMATHEDKTTPAPLTAGGIP